MRETTQSCEVLEGVRAVTISPPDSPSYDAPKVRFFATVGEEPEIEVVLDQPPRSYPQNCLVGVFANSPHT